MTKCQNKSFASESLEMVYQQRQSLFQLTAKVEVGRLVLLQYRLTWSLRLHKFTKLTLEERKESVPTMGVCFSACKYVFTQKKILQQMYMKMG